MRRPPKTLTAMPRRTGISGGLLLRLPPIKFHCNLNKIVCRNNCIITEYVFVKVSHTTIAALQNFITRRTLNNGTPTKHLLTPNAQDVASAARLVKTRMERLIVCLCQSGAPVRQRHKWALSRARCLGVLETARTDVQGKLVGEGTKRRTRCEARIL